MKKNLLFLILFFNYINASDFFEIIKEKPREERKKLCLAKMNENKYSNPNIAYKAANCLLYNGYGKLAIPLFTLYINNGYNQKYFNNRIGYGWLHSANWYKVEPSILRDMTNGKDLYSWVVEEISNEEHHNRMLYGLSLEDLLKMDLKMYSRMGKGIKDKEKFKKCNKLKIELKGISCIVEKRTFTDCKEVESNELKIDCLEKK